MFDQLATQIAHDVAKAIELVGIAIIAALTNEENSLIQKLARTVVGTNSVHSCEST